MTDIILNREKIEKEIADLYESGRKGQNTPFRSGWLSCLEYILKEGK